MTSAEKGSHTPGPLSVKDDGGRQYRIESDFYRREGEWNDVYVAFSGYFGSYGPHMFAAAPELFAELKRITDRAANGLPITLRDIDFSRALLAKASRP